MLKKVFLQTDPVRKYGLNTAQKRVFVHCADDHFKMGTNAT